MIPFRLSGLSKMLFLSIAFSMALLALRIMYTDTYDYGFYIWNTFLAAIPYVCSNMLDRQPKMNLFPVILLAVWLLFFPNAPYIITDLLHYEERPGVPYWFDIILVASATWNGLILGIVSLMQVELFLAKHIPPIWVKLSVFTSLLLCGYGIFMGRFLRFNSWDIFTNPQELAYTSAHHVLTPHHYPKLWVFTVLFAVMLSLIYYTLKKMPRLITKQG